MSLKVGDLVRTIESCVDARRGDWGRVVLCLGHCQSISLSDVSSLHGMRSRSH